MLNILLLILICIQSLSTIAQKPTIDQNTYSNWPSLHEASISNNGEFVVYKYGPLNGKDILVIQTITGKFKKEILQGSEAIFTEDSRKVIYKLSGDSMGIFNLDRKTVQYVNNVIDFKTPKEGNGRWLAYQLNDESKNLVIRNLISGKEKRFPFVHEYIFNNTGSVVAIVKADSLLWIDLSKSEEKFVMSGGRAYNVTFDSKGSQLAFTTQSLKGEGYTLHYYNKEMDSSRIECKKEFSNIPLEMNITNTRIHFTQDGRRIFFGLKRIAESDGARWLDTPNVIIWDYKDPILQTEVEAKKKELDNKIFNAVKKIGETSVILLDRKDTSYWSIGNSTQENYVLAVRNFGVKEEWRPILKGLYLISTNNGIAKKIVEGINTNISQFTISPNENYVVWFDDNTKQYNSYNIHTGTINLGISKQIKEPLNYQNLNEIRGSYGIAGWLSESNSILVYDQHDIWQIDLQNKKVPINITNAYGKKHQITFRIWNEEKVFLPKQKLLLCAINNLNKDNGFYNIGLGSNHDPTQCSIGPYFYYMTNIFLGWFIRNNRRPMKAKNAERYIVCRESAQASPNLFYTKDFKSFIQLTQLYPEKAYNWMSSELVHWPHPNGKQREGIIYKPENFDSTRKYPVIFNYYDANRSYELNTFKKPEFSGHNIDIPTYVSNGYIIFIPNLYYKTGENCSGITESIVSAAKFVSQYSWIDSARMGLQGHSFGGYATNCVLTHSTLFSAACESAGMVDYISGYGGLYHNFSRQSQIENGQGNMGTTLWDRPDLYTKNSPVFYLNQVTTPLLMMHGKKDMQVYFNQAIELFTGLRRLGKKVWLLQYEDAGHVVVGKNAEDFTFRMRQFFDYYLKGLPAPKWMMEK